MPVRNRVEAIIVDQHGQQWAEQLLNPRYPLNLGAIRCPGGKIEDGENPAQALIRELWEEYEIPLAPSQLILLWRISSERVAISRFRVRLHAVNKIRSVDGNEKLVQVSTEPPPWL